MYYYVLLRQKLLMNFVINMVELASLSCRIEWEYDFKSNRSYSIVLR